MWAVPTHININNMPSNPMEKKRKLSNSFKIFWVVEFLKRLNKIKINNTEVNNTNGVKNDFLLLDSPNT